MARYKKILKPICYSILFILAVIILFSFLPLKNNYKFLVVRSGSMEPKIKVGSLIITAPSGDYRIGDVVTYKIPGRGMKNVVTHRIISAKGSGDNQTFITKGDANNGQDLAPVPKDNIVGKMRLKIPYLGYLVGYVQTQLGLIIIIIIPTTIIVYREAQKIRREIEILKTNRQLKPSLSSQSQPSLPSSPSKPFDSARGKPSPKKPSKSSKPKNVPAKKKKL